MWLVARFQCGLGAVLQLRDGVMSQSFRYAPGPRRPPPRNLWSSYTIGRADLVGYEPLFERHRATARKVGDWY